jgi:predicted GH43/DUF377 family glycosyl hydrolase
VQKTIFLLASVLLILSACAEPGTISPTSLPTSTNIPVTPTLSATFTPEITPTSVPFFTVYSQQPIVPKGQPGAWDDRYTDPGAVIYHDGMFHMFRNGFRGFPAESQVGYVTSPDGYTWTKQGEEPVFKTVDVPYAKIAMYASSVLVEEDGTWVLYFYTWDSKAYPSDSVIGRATAPSPTGPWVADPEPVLKPGIAGDWDAKQVLAPDVLKTEDGYLMYYSGVNLSGTQMIGIATSSDGINWIKYNDESTVDTPFSESDPVLPLGEKGNWDAGWVHQPRVFQTAEGWVMIYRGMSETRGPTMKLGLATSPDGIRWARYPSNPLFQPREVKGSGQFYFTNAILKEDVYYLFVESGIGQATQIYLATHHGSIVP